MPAKFVNQARMTVTSTGTASPMTLGAAVQPFNTFATAGVNTGDIVAYSIIDGLNNSEKGWGVYDSSGTVTLTRNVYTSTNGNSAIDLSGQAQVFIDPSLADLQMLSLTAQSHLGGL